MGGAYVICVVFYTGRESDMLEVTLNLTGPDTSRFEVTVVVEHVERIHTVGVRGEL